MSKSKKAKKGSASNAAHSVSKKAVAKKSTGAPAKKGAAGKASAPKAAPKAAAEAAKPVVAPVPTPAAPPAPKPAAKKPAVKASTKKLEKKEEHLPWEGPDRHKAKAAESKTGPSLVPPSAPTPGRPSSTMRVAPKKVEEKSRVLRADDIASMMTATPTAPKRTDAQSTMKVQMAVPKTSEGPKPSDKPSLGPVVQGLQSLQAGNPQNGQFPVFKVKG